ncbi:COX8 [Cyberlindnera jadinii]|uniref:Cytochrome c oxidase subunit 8, mitochondrial n=2 Tax=Cyberlindnera jadinii (strain ATCC 18201 / CBS 1600 / BCRC 20928 / JCM 3617 / NBRC 0987 / NRRL Y-1542) TaxID=983966 RepID=A0A0H5C5Z4_CYBJN|nr:COX8 [Cyberlindnera jadinii]
MFARQLVQTSKRAFSSSSKSAVHFKEGVYENIPFKVHNRKIPYAVIHFGFFGIAAAVPFIASFVQLKRSGAF